jgi:hypothetical protein
MKKGSDMDAKETTEREVGRRLPYSDPHAPITSFRCDYALRKQVCLLEEGKRGCGCFRVVLFFHCIRFSSLRSNFELAVQFHGHGYTALFSFGSENGAT